MIAYSPFWNTLKNSSETTYSLINKHHISSAIIDKLRKNKPKKIEKNKAHQVSLPDMPYILLHA